MQDYVALSLYFFEPIGLMIFIGIFWVHRHEKVFFRAHAKLTRAQIVHSYAHMAYMVKRYACMAQQQASMAIEAIVS